MQTNIIYNAEDLRALLVEKTKKGSFIIYYDDFYFEEIDKDVMITRDVYSIANRYTKTFNVIKYIEFKVKEKYTTREMYEFIMLLRAKAIVIVSIFNPKKKECFLIYISSKNDLEIEQQIKMLLEMEED